MTILNGFNITPTSNLLDITQTWVSGTLYQPEDEVSWNGRVWISTKADNTDEPSTNVLTWTDDRPTNSTAFYDEYPATYSENNGIVEIVYEHVNDANMIMLSNIYGTDLKIMIEENGEIKVDETIPLSSYYEPLDWWEYYYKFKDAEFLTDYIYNIERLYFDAKITIKITPRADGIVKIGMVKIGQAEAIACTLAEVSLDRNPSLDLKYFNGKLKPIGGEGWTKINFKVWFSDDGSLKPFLNDLLKNDGKVTGFIGDDTGELLEYSIIGMYNGYAIDYVNRTSTLAVYAVDNY